MTDAAIRRVAAIGAGTIGASWAAVFLARGLTVAASDPMPGAEEFLKALYRRVLAEPSAPVAVA
jgi:3-hydroxyacyl-CoA dehydrogenase